MTNSLDIFCTQNATRTEKVSRRIVIYVYVNEMVKKKAGKESFKLKGK